MKVTAFFHGIFFKNQIILRATDNNDLLMIKKMFDSKKSREERSKQEILLKCEIDAQFQKRSFKQLATVWVLVTAIFDSMECRKPTESERYDLYLDLLEEYADKVPSKITGELRSVRISESNTMAAARFIDGLLYHLATYCELKTDLQADVRKVLYEWELWRGKQNEDINDYRTLNDLKERVKYSEASGKSPVEYHHIVSRGAAPQFIDCAWNILALTHEEHMFFHKYGWNTFLDKYPHLRGRVEKAIEKAGKLPTPEREVKETFDTEELAQMALQMNN